MYGYAGKILHVDLTNKKSTIENIGEKSVYAQFKGEISLEDKIIELIQNDEKALVPLGEETNFQFYFTPRKPGRYIVSGRVFYDSKRTYEKSAIINVKPRGLNLHSFIIPLIYTILIIAIIILLYKIRKERKSYQIKLRFLGK